jgi:3-hydroxyisobutyrate dehydrogenase
VWNRIAARAAPLAAQGARLASTPAEAAEGVDAMLTTGDAISDAMIRREGALSSLRPRSAWIEMATIGDEWTERLASLASGHGLEVIDAPASASDGPARAGELVVPPPAQTKSVSQCNRYSTSSAASRSGSGRPETAAG